MKKLLVVDDEQVVREFMAKLLECPDYEIIEADNGTAAFDLAKMHQPDLVIADVVMDNMNGLMLKELLREDKKTASIPVILMTGFAQGVEAWQADPDDEYLEKPFSTAELLSAVEGAINRSLRSQ